MNTATNGELAEMRVGGEEALREALGAARKGARVRAYVLPQAEEAAARMLPVTFAAIPPKALDDNPLVAQQYRKARAVDGEQIMLRSPRQVAPDTAASETVSTPTLEVDGHTVGIRLKEGQGTLEVIAGAPAGGALPQGDAPAEAVPQASGRGSRITPYRGGGGVNDPRLLRHSAREGRNISDEAFEAILDFKDQGSPSGALLLKEIPIGDIPPTPSDPRNATKDNLDSETALLAICSLLGQPVGYQPEHGGDLIQNISPTRKGAMRQVSTSSGVTLEFHTEAAFHPHMPRYLALLCLRGDPEARTTLASARSIVNELSEEHIDLLYQSLYTTGIDESYTGIRSSARSLPQPILRGPVSNPQIWLDNDLMEGLTGKAQEALEAAAEAARRTAGSITLEAGDLLIVDNHYAVHGRSPFTPRFDGTDRWLQRSLIVHDHRSAGADLDGRIISTQFMP